MCASCALLVSGWLMCSSVMLLCPNACFCMSYFYRVWCVNIHTCTHLAFHIPTSHFGSHFWAWLSFYNIFGQFLQVIFYVCSHSLIDAFLCVSKWSAKLIDALDCCMMSLINACLNTFLHFSWASPVLTFYLLNVALLRPLCCQCSLSILTALICQLSVLTLSIY